MMGPAIDVTVNRNYIYQDAFDQLTEDKGKTKKLDLKASAENNFSICKLLTTHLLSVNF